MATGESLASKTVRPNEKVALTSVGYVGSVIILGTTYRLVPMWTNVACPESASAPSARAIGIEITAPTRLSVTALNKVLRELGFPLATRADLAPVLAAA